jgi:hypothetical protein
MRSTRLAEKAGLLMILGVALATCAAAQGRGRLDLELAGSAQTGGMTSHAVLRARFPFPLTPQRPPTGTLELGGVTYPLDNFDATFDYDGAGRPTRVTFLAARVRDGSGQSWISLERQKPRPPPGSTRDFAGTGEVVGRTWSFGLDVRSERQQVFGPLVAASRASAQGDSSMDSAEASILPSKVHQLVRLQGFTAPLARARVVGMTVFLHLDRPDQKLFGHLQVGRRRLQLQDIRFEMREQTDERPRYLPMRSMSARLVLDGEPVGELAIEVDEAPFGAHEVPVARGRFRVGRGPTQRLLGRIRSRHPERVQAAQGSGAEEAGTLAGAF